MKFSLLLLIFAGILWAEGSVEVHGTSTFHDWEMVSHSAVVHMKEKHNQIKELKVSIVIETLKSGSDGMDENAYKVFDVDRKSPIIFTLIEQKADGSLDGLITIGKHEKRVTVIPDSIDNGVIRGSFKEKMSIFGVEPPTFFLGMMSTGDEIEIIYTISK
ncbi:MAG: hypothetical protein MUP09_00020 [Thiovulaceae bacterium]|nr:hypothetical protein [Sulfurimonadaceae bacterium]